VLQQLSPTTHVNVLMSNMHFVSSDDDIANFVVLFSSPFIEFVQKDDLS